MLEVLCPSTASQKHNTKIGSFCAQIQRTLFDKFSNLPFLFSVKNTGCVIEPQFLANVGTFCVDAVLGHNVSTIKLNVLDAFPKSADFSSFHLEFFLEFN